MKRKINHQYLLLGCVVVLALLCFLSIDAPIRFDHERKEREVAVKERLMKIRQAEELYRQRHGTYTGSFETLAKEKLLADSLSYIPYSDQKRFELQTNAIVSKSGQQVPLMECRAAYGEYLQGLDKTSVADLIQEAEGAGRYPGLKIGDLEVPNNNAGNWE